MSGFAGQQHPGAAQWRLLVAVIAGFATIASLLAVPPAHAASPIQFGKIQYDSPGSDTGSGASINAEYVVLRNTSARAVSLTGWTVRDALPVVYEFGTFSLGAGKTVVLRTGKGTGSATTRYWGMGRYVWNNPRRQGGPAQRSGSHHGHLPVDQDRRRVRQLSVAGTPGLSRR